jgi:hypothetical protein
MAKKSILSVLIISLILGPGYLKPAFCNVVSAEYLCQMGVNFYQGGRLEDSLQEFRKALLVDPDNKIAKEYINKIFNQQEPMIREQPSFELDEFERPTREEMMNQAFEDLTKKEFQRKLEAKPDTAKEEKVPLLKMQGEAQLSLGLTPNNTIWKRANYDLNERNWRMLSHDAFNNGFNTYDTRVFDRFDLDLDTDKKEGFNFHTNITVDPWSFTGKGPKTTVTSANGDTAEIELKYWSNMGYTVNETIYTNLKGNTFNLPELKVRNGKVDPFSASGDFTPADTFSFPGMKIDRDFQPVRELWVDYLQDPVSFRIFPIAYQDQALTSDDPLNITNRHIWWEDSLWLRRYEHGIYNSGASPVDFTKGWWDNSLNYLSRDSNGAYLTALRGFSFNLSPGEDTSLVATVATPKHLWQDYEAVDNVSAAARFKQRLGENLLLGSTFTSRIGLNTDDGHKRDYENYVGGVDMGYEITEGVKGSAEVLMSRTLYDLSNADYRTKSQGNAYYFSLVTRYPRESIMDLEYGYDQIKLQKDESFLIKSRFYASRIDKGFDSGLSSFRNTRQDTFWGRHIHFRKPADYYYSGLKYPSLKWDDIQPIRIGDGIDTGRDVIGFRIEAICENKFENLFDLRNVHNVNGKNIETVVRDELTAQFGDRLTLKALGIYQHLPKTRGGIDPFIYDTQTGEFVEDWSSDPIDDGLDPSLKTGSVGLEYAFFDWLTLNGIWERTNDYTLAYGNFPRSVLNSSQLSRIYYEYGKKYRGQELYIYDQQFFPQPPYHFYNIFKTGLLIAPMDNLDIYLDYTRNEFEMAAQNSDNMNHVGIEMSYMPTKKTGIVLKYTYSRWKDLDRLVNGITKPVGHHNFFGEFRYLPSKDDEFILQYGEGNTSAIGNITFDPFGGSLLTIDTQHIIRAYYRRKF